MIWRRRSQWENFSSLSSILETPRKGLLRSQRTLPKGELILTSEGEQHSKFSHPPPPYLSIYFSEPYTYKIAARILVTLPLYAPTLKASKVQCPYFLLISKGEDLILTTRSAKKMALKAPRGSYEIVGDEKSGHFSPYEHTTTGNAVEEICEKAGEFLKRTVPL